MSQLGERLRQARESQSISLAQAAVETRILQQWLIALEEGALERLPNDVAARGFVRNYAQYLGLSADEIVELYRRERGESSPIRIVPVTHPPQRRSYVLPSFFGVFFVTVALVGVMYVVLSAIGRIGDGEVSSIASVDTPTIPTPTALATVPPNTAVVGGASPLLPTASPTPLSVAATSEPSPTPELAAPIVVEVNIESGAGTSWLRVQTDGATVYEQNMSGGEQEVFLAQREVFIRSGNPTIVQVTVNGLQQGPIGQIPGQPVNWYWPPQ